MSELVLARRDVPPRLYIWSWALADDASEEQYRNVRTLDVDGIPRQWPTRALAARTSAPVGSGVSLGYPGSAAQFPGVVLESAGPVARVRSPLGEITVEARAVRPASAPGRRPFAAGASLVSARTDLVRAPVDLRRFALRWESLRLRDAFERDGLGGAAWVDVALLPHQLAVAREVLGSPTVRHVLADEVGLGKTVEALMIWSALSADEPGLRCVIATPRSLVTQWSFEVRRRSEHRLRAGASDDLPPVYDPQGATDAMDVDNPRAIVITEHDALRALAKRGAVIDMLIVDEAHALKADERAAVEAIAKSARHLLLLTATPREGRRMTGAAREQRKSFAWAVGLVDPKWPPVDARDDDDLARSLERTVDESIRRARKYDAAIAKGAEIGSLARQGVGVLPPVGEACGGDARALLKAGALLERVVRTRRATLGDGLTASRRLIRVPVEYREEEVALFGEIRAMDSVDRAKVVRQACSSWQALANMSGGRTTALRQRLDVIRETGGGARPDAKLEALLDLCARIWDESPEAKVVIRCEYAETRDLVVGALDGLLRAGGLRRSPAADLAAWGERGDDVVGPVAELRQTQDAMIEALRKPSDAGRSMLAHLWAFERGQDGGAAVLVANDVASTGLNLQFASALILYDLPWTPGLAEQWIGRLDRVGQRAGEVRVYAMSHRSLPTERLLDVYERIGLFDARGFHVSPDVERAISDLLQPADDDERTWEEAVGRILEALRAEDEDPAIGASLDLPIGPPPDDASARAASGRFLEALRSAGFALAERNSWVTEVSWPPSNDDALEIPTVAAALRPRPQNLIGRRPDELAERGEQRRPLNLSDRRLGGGRWIRPARVDLLTPRHPLFLAIEDELNSDPSLALAGLRCAKAIAGVPCGLYLVAQIRTFPGLGGDAIAWRCRATQQLQMDDEMETFWRSVAEGLRRMMRVRLGASQLSDAWLLRPGESDPRPQGAQRLDALIAAIPRAVPARAAEVGGLGADRIRALLAALERPPYSPSEASLDEVRRIAREVSRDAALRLERIIERRRADAGATGSGDAWRGLRESRGRALAVAESMRAVVSEISNNVRLGALEAETPRVVAAAVVEVTT